MLEKLSTCQNEFTCLDTSEPAIPKSLNKIEANIYLDMN